MWRCRAGGLIVVWLILVSCLCVKNWDLLSTRSVHSYYSVSAKDIIRNRNTIGAMLSPCLTPILMSMDVSILLMMSLTTLLSYMYSIAEHSLGWAPYFPSIVMISAWLEVSKMLTRSENATHVGSLWLCLRCGSVFIVNVPYWNSTPGVDLNWHFTPNFLTILNNNSHLMLLYILLPISIRVTPIHLLG